MISDGFANGFKSILDQCGVQVSVKYYNETVGSVWDDDLVLSISGTTWTSGIVFPLNLQKSSQDSVLLEQGKVQDNDKRLYVNGSTLFTGSNLQCQVQIGSPTGEQYYLLSDGAIANGVNGVDIYKKVYIRRLTNGSLIGV